METTGVGARPSIYGLERLNIQCLPCVPDSNRDQLPTSPVVYFVSRDNRLLYIGASRNLRKRWFSFDYRWRGWVKRRFLTVSWLDVSMTLLPDVEVFLIKLLRPEFNHGALRYPKSGPNRNPTGCNRYSLRRQRLAKQSNGNGHK